VTRVVVSTAVIYCCVNDYHDMLYSYRFVPLTLHRSLTMVVRCIWCISQCVSLVNVLVDHADNINSISLITCLYNAY